MKISGSRRFIFFKGNSVQAVAAAAGTLIMQSRCRRL